MTLESRKLKEPTKLALLVEGRYDSLLKALEYLAPTEFERLWSAVELDNVIHTDSRCHYIDNFDNIHYNQRVRPENLRKLTLKEMLDVENHCHYCYKSYLENGFNHSYLFKAYKPILESYKALLRSDFSLASQYILTDQTNEYFSQEIRHTILSYYKKRSLVRLRNLEDLCLLTLPLKENLLNYDNIYPLKSNEILTTADNISNFINRRDSLSGIVPLTNLRFKEEQLEIFDILLFDARVVTDPAVIYSIAQTSILLG